jgi:hypothetical protein
MLGSPFGAGHLFREKRIDVFPQALKAERRIGAFEAALVTRTVHGKPTLLGVTTLLIVVAVAVAAGSWVYGMWTHGLAILS